MTEAPAGVVHAPASTDLRLGVVSFVNTLPLIDGLEQTEGITLRCSVPSLLIDQLLAGEVDVALCSTIDYQRSPEPLLLLPCGLLGCDGPTWTVRLYSALPIEQIRRVYCDTDSHTSITLMRILLRECFGITPEVIDYDAREHVARNRPLEWPETMLLIGDKVVTDSPPAVRYPHQLDLGELWWEHTGRPFVFAAWMARRTCDAGRLRAAAMLLDRQWRYNRLRIDNLVHEQARARRWPADLAGRYLKERLKYTVTPERLAGLELFYGKALELGLIAQRRPVEFASV